MTRKNKVATLVLLSMIAVAIGGLVISSMTELEVNVSAAAGYQGQAEVAVDPADALTLVVAGSDGSGSGPTVWSSIDGGGVSPRPCCRCSSMGLLLLKDLSPRWRWIETAFGTQLMKFTISTAD